MPINLKGKQYVTVAERVQALHDSLKDEDVLVIETEVLSHNPVVIRAKVTINQCQYSGISAANFDKPIEKMSPYEIAETSALGRALGFAGFGSVESIASADEMIKASYADKVNAMPAPRIESTQKATKIALSDVPMAKTTNHPCTKCGGPTSLAVVGPTDKNGNPNKNAGKPYWKCPTDRFSEWADQPVTPEDDFFAGMDLK